MTKTIAQLFNALLGCRHKRTSWPQRKRTKSGERAGNYIVCLDCGQEFPYVTVQLD